MPTLTQSSPEITCQVNPYLEPTSLASQQVSEMMVTVQVSQKQMNLNEINRCNVSDPVQASILSLCYTVCSAISEELLFELIGGYYHVQRWENQKNKFCHDSLALSDYHLLIFQEASLLPNNHVLKEVVHTWLGSLF
jgi:hypothetical protein